MKDYITVKDAARSWELSERRVTGFCKEGRIEGAFKDGRRWLIPIYAERPDSYSYVADSGFVDEHYQKMMVMGTEYFKEAVQKSYYVDKTEFIREILNAPDKVLLFTRPRRFGKTLNMDMLRVFLEKTDEDNSVYFKHLHVWNDKVIMDEMGMYPVIFITFKGATDNTWNSTINAIADVIANEYKRHPELTDSPKLLDIDRMYYRKALHKELTEDELRYSLRNLSQMLYAHYGKQCFIIVDEYDSPIQSAHTYGFYDDAIRFMRLLFTEALKTNEALNKGILTGILRGAKESLFSGLDNIKVYSVLDRKFSKYFGFTEEELKKIAYDYKGSNKLDEIGAWYDGYDFGGTRIYNPWSVASYFNGDMRPALYWVNTGENSLLREILENADPDIEENILRLMKGESVSTFIDNSFVYSTLNSSFDQICSLLVSTGYLKATNPTVVTNDVRLLCEVAIPNLEVSAVWKSEVMAFLYNGSISRSADLIKTALSTGNVESIKRSLSEFLLSAVSFHEAVHENFYHGLLLGIVSVFDQYKVKSNRESGLGRFDIMLEPNRGNLPGIIIEVKYLKNADSQELMRSAESAVEQIIDMQYAEELREKGVKEILGYGVSFCSKHVEVVVSDLQ